METYPPVNVDKRLGFNMPMADFAYFLVSANCAKFRGIAIK